MSDTRTTAIHEAGHGVARLRLFPHEHFDHISIEQDDDSLGQIVLTSDTTVISKSATLEESEELFMADAIFACAGYAACVVAGISEDQAQMGCESDFERAGHRKDSACELALDLLGREENVRAVHLVADKLMELRVIDYDHISVLIELADGECSEEEYREYLEFRTIG